ncbi:FxsA family protein [Actinoallomurus acaciae]|uniref:FxsA family protein n=1 Tax=Actinoallomurus acaciae TaxID=502577 RepID=A0ABV5YJK2_9ACTN
MLRATLVLAFLAVPVLEIYVILQVGHAIGGWPTVGLLILESLIGAWIIRREGRRAWRALTEALRQGGLPDRELADAALVLAGGVLLLTPGFVTDVAGLLFVLPFTRPLVRRALSAYVGRRVRVAQSRAAASFGGFGGMPRPRSEPGPQNGSTGDADTGHRVVRGEVIEDDRDPH